MLNQTCLLFMKQVFKFTALVSVIFIANFNKLLAHNIAYSLTTSPVSCYNSNDGKLSVTVTTYSGGRLNYHIDGPSQVNVDSVGQVDFMGMQAGKYHILVTDLNTSDTLTQSFEITSPPGAHFNYPGIAYCSNGSNPSPVFTDENTAGKFSAAQALVIDINSGLVNLAASTAGTYKVYNVIPASNTCPAVKDSVNITITVYKTAKFSYASTVCATGTNTAPTIAAGAKAGIFFSNSNNCSINQLTGAILGNSLSGTYTITNLVFSSGACPALEDSAYVVVETRPLQPDSVSGPKNLNVFESGSYTPYYANALTTTTYFQWVATGAVISVLNANTCSSNWSDPGTKTVNAIPFNSCGYGPYRQKVVYVGNVVTDVDDAVIQSPISFVNPVSNGYVTLSRISENVAISSINGQLLVSAKNVSAIDISSFQQGLYIININGKSDKLLVK